MKAIFKLMVCIVATSSIACCQSVEEKLVGSWSVYTTNIYHNLIIFRSDHQYFIYNPNSVSNESIGKRENLKSGDILIGSHYTSMIEQGTWSYSHATHMLTLSERNILKKGWSDFSETYGKERVLNFYLKQINKNKVKFCFNKQGIQRCIECERGWSYLASNWKKIFYQEVSKEYAGIGNQTEEILLSGYETELKLSYEFYKNPGKLVVEDRNGKVLFSMEVEEINKKSIQEIPLRGVTKLVFKVISNEETSNWKIKVEIK